MRQKLFTILIVASMAGARASRAATPESLAEQALRQNAELDFYVAEIAAAKGAVRTAGAKRNPELNTQAGYKNSRSKSGGESGEGPAFSLSFNQTFEYPGRIALRTAIAKHDVQLAELHLEQFRLSLGARVRTLAYGIAMARQRSVAAQEAAARFQALSEVLEARPAAGVAPQLEGRLIAANVVTFGRQEREALLKEKTMTAELNQLCGRLPGAPLELSVRAVVFSKPALASLLAAARTHAFDVRIRQAELAQQGFKVALSKNERYPAFTVGPFYSFERAADTEHQAGIGLSLPLPMWDRNAGTIASSKARVQQAGATLAAAERDVARRVAQNAEILEAKRSEIERLRSDELNKSREAADLADRSYRLGAVPLTLYVETQKQYVELISTIADLQRDALGAAYELEILTSQKLYGGGKQP